MLKGEKIETRHKRTPLEEVVPLKAPFIVFIDPCGACNFKCSFCPCNTNDYNKEERHKKMSFPLFQKVIDELCQFEEQVKVIYLYGFGEPFLNRDVIKMAKYIKEKNACRELRIVTNGSLLNPELNQQIVDSGIDLVRISIEALDEAGYQKLCSAKINYEQFLANIKDLHERGKDKIKVAAKIVNATLKTEADVQKFHDMYDPITDFTFVEDIVAGWPEFDEMVMPEDALMESDNWIWKRDNYQRCSFALTMMMIHANGAVCPCPNDWKMANQYGDANTDNLQELWKSQQLKNFRLMHMEKSRKDIPFCCNCICSGYDKVDHVADVIADRLRKLS